MRKKKIDNRRMREIKRIKEELGGGGESTEEG